MQQVYEVKKECIELRGNPPYIKLLITPKTYLSGIISSS